MVKSTDHNPIGALASEIAQLAEESDAEGGMTGPQVLSAVAAAYAYLARRYGVTEDDAVNGLKHIWPHGVKCAEDDMAILEDMS
jgi:hypothetical protein